MPTRIEFHGSCQKIKKNDCMDVVGSQSPMDEKHCSEKTVTINWRLDGNDWRRVRMRRS